LFDGPCPDVKEEQPEDKDDQFLKVLPPIGDAF
jgi:hypothetical protein